MMGNKVNPTAFRLGEKKLNHTCEWFTSSRRMMQEYIVDDSIVQTYILDFFQNFGTLTGVKLRRPQPGSLSITLESVKPSSLIGLKGELINKLSLELQKISISEKIKLSVVQVAEDFTVNSLLMTNLLARELAARRNLKLLLNKLIYKLKFANILGYKIVIKGRLNGSAKTKTLKFSDGKLPLQSISYDIDYTCLPVVTQYGLISISVWLCRGLIDKKKMLEAYTVAHSLDAKTSLHTRKQGKTAGKNTTHNDRKKPVYRTSARKVGGTKVAQEEIEVKENE